MDINKDGLVDLNEFLETFRLCEQAKGNYCKPKMDVMQSPTTKSRSNGLHQNGIKKQSTEDDEEELLLDCGDETPKKMVENGKL